MADTVTIRRGSTFRWTLRPAQSEQRYVQVSAIDKTAPVRIHTGVAHQLLDGWRFVVTGAKGMVQINAANTPPRASDYYVAKVIDPTTVEVNAVNATGFGAYTGGATLQYGIPMDLTGYTVRGQIRKTVKTAAVLLDLGAYATVDAANCAISFDVPESVTAALVGPGGVFDIELVSAGGFVMALPIANVVFTDEVTRP